jgi:hypothetical protein
MQRSIPWGWILLGLALLLLPGPAGRLVLNLLGGITLTLLALPLLAGGAALIGWQVLQRRLRTCAACGASSLGSPTCPACGTPFAAGEGSTAQGRNADGRGAGIHSGPGSLEIDPRNVTINVEAVDVDGAADQSAGDGGGSQRTSPAP